MKIFKKRPKDTHKITFRERIIQTVKTASTSSKIMFLLCAVSAVMTVVSNFVADWVVLTALLAVLWLASIILHSFFKRNRQGNPFTAITILCAGISLLCFFFVMTNDPTYNEANEPINQEWDLLQRNLNDENDTTESKMHHIGFNLHVGNPFGELKHNVLITDENHNVLYAYSSWKTNGEQQLRALISPSPLSNSSYEENFLMLLVNGNGDIVSTFRINQDYANTLADTSYQYLNISDAETTKSSDPIFDKYFPSFSPQIDSNACELADTTVFYRTQENYSEIHMRDWDGQRIDDIAMPLSQTDERQLIEELNALDSQQRADLRNYLAWLSKAKESIYPTNNYNRPLEARMMSSSDGKLNLYMLYEYDEEILSPRNQSYIKKIRLDNTVRATGLLLLPIFVIFLAFWTFMDAKRRGHKYPALWAVLTLIGNVIAWIVYMMVRPSAMVNTEGKIVPKGTCPLCGMKLKSDFIACPGCGILLRNKCRNCYHVLENDWSFCPYCTTPIVREKIEEVAQVEAEDKEKLSKELSISDVE